MSMTDARRIGSHHFQTPRQLLAGCLLASIVVHVVVFLWLPGWQRRTADAPVPVLDVVLAAAAPQIVAPAAPAAAVPPRRAETPPPDRLTRTIPATDFPPTFSPTVTGTAPVVAAAGIESRVAEEAKTPAVRAESPVTPPLFNAAYLRNPAPAYPAAARRRGDQGTAMLKVLVDSEGAPLRIELDQSSGSRLLDGAALDAVKSWRFVPARRGAENVEGWVRVPVVFRLES
jgi:protein TonB